MVSNAMVQQPTRPTVLDVSKSFESVQLRSVGFVVLLNVPLYHHTDELVWVPDALLISCRSERM